jgi:hypothetical protein
MTGRDHPTDVHPGSVGVGQRPFVVHDDGRSDGAAPVVGRGMTLARIRPPMGGAAAVVVGSAAPNAGVWSYADAATCAELLRWASQMLPSVVCGWFVPDDVHLALFELAVVACGEDSGGRHRLADRAEAMLASYLVETGQAPPGLSVSSTLRAWPDRFDVSVVSGALLSAARFWTRWRQGTLSAVSKRTVRRSRIRARSRGAVA